MSLKSALQILKRSEGLRTTLLNTIGNAATTSFSALAMMIITRALGPEKFGEFSVGFALVLILVRLNDFGLNTSVIKYASAAKNDDERNFIYSITLKYKKIFSLICIILGIVFFKQISQFFSLREPLVILAACTVGLATAYYEHLLVTLQSLHTFSKAVLINGIQAGSKLLFSASLMFFGVQNILIFFITYIMAPVIPVLFSKYILPSSTHFSFTKEYPPLRAKVIALARHSSLALVCAGIIENIDVLFLQRYLTAYETGLFSGVSRIALLFSLVAYSVGDVLNTRVARYQKKSDFISYFKKTALLAVATVGGFLIFLPFASDVIRFTIGAEYQSGTSILLILVASSFITILVMPFIALFYSLNANWYFSVSGIIQLFIILVGNYFFVPLYGLEAAALTRLFARLFLLIFTLIVGILIFKKKYDHSSL